MMIAILFLKKRLYLRVQFNARLLLNLLKFYKNESFLYIYELLKAPCKDSD